MTPQERARDLCEKFEGILGRSIPTGDDPFFPESKECAKVCCQEIIDTLASYRGCYDWEDIQKGDHEYFKQVLKEIDKL